MVDRRHDPAISLGDSEETLVFALRTLDEQMPWRLDAACRTCDTPDVFFPGKGESALPAKRICARCPVLYECRDATLAEGVCPGAGVLGGMSENDRRDIHMGRKSPADLLQGEAPDARAS